jgi:hypothetical protein
MNANFHLYSIPFLGTCYMFLSFLYLYLFGFLNGFVYVLLLIFLLVLNAIFMRLALKFRPVYRSFIFSFVFVFLLILYESPLAFLDSSKTLNFLYTPTYEVVANSGIYPIGIVAIQLSEEGKIFMQSEADLLKVINIKNYQRYNRKNNFIFELLHIVKNQDVEVVKNLRRFTKGTNTEINEFLARDDVNGASAGLALALSSLAKEYGWNNSRPVAVTGAIDKKGNVLGVLLVREKLLTAARDGHSHAIVPEANLKEALKAIEELNLSIVVYGAKSIEDAVGVIEKWNEN